MWELDCEEGWAPKNWCFWTVMLEKTLESLLDCKEIQPVHSEGDQPWDFFGRNDAKAEAPVLWPPHVKSWLIGKDSDAGRDWGQEEKGTTEDEMAGWHHWLDGREFEWTPGDGDGQGGLVCCSSWGRKESDTTEWLNWTELTDTQNSGTLKSWLIGKDFDAGRDWGQEEKGMTEDKMAGWHHGLDGHESEWAPGVGDGHGGLACCNSWDRKESDTTERLYWTESSPNIPNSLTCFLSSLQSYYCLEPFLPSTNDIHPAWLSSRIKEEERDRKTPFNSHFISIKQSPWSTVQVWGTLFCVPKALSRKFPECHHYTSRVSLTALRASKKQELCLCVYILIAQHLLNELLNR